MSLCSLFRFGKALDLGKVTEAGMLEPFGNLQNRVEIHQTFFYPIGITLPDRCRRVRSGIDFAAQQRKIQFGRAVTWDELRFL